MPISLQKYFWIINLLFLTAISYTLADISGFIIKEKLQNMSKVESNIEDNISIESEEIKPALDFYSVIFSKNIFSHELSGSKKIDSIEGVGKTGDLGSSPTDMKNDVVEIQVSPLNYILVGTIVIGEKGYMAFLEDKTSKIQKGYLVGDEIQPQVKLVEIKRTSVLIERNGKKEVLFYPTLDPKPEDYRQTQTQTLPLSGNSGIISQTKTSRVLDKRYIDNEFREMGRLMTQIRAVPSEKKGFKVFNIVKGSLFEKLGLENGDIVQRINGTDLSSPDKAMELYMQLKGSTNIQIDVLRNGNIMNFDYQIQ